jgi:hypothetical protein
VPPSDPLFEIVSFQERRVGPQPAKSMRNNMLGRTIARHDVAIDTPADRADIRHKLSALDATGRVL